MVDEMNPPPSFLLIGSVDQHWHSHAREKIPMHVLSPCARTLEHEMRLATAPGVWSGQSSLIVAGKMAQTWLDFSAEPCPAPATAQL